MRSNLRLLLQLICLKLPITLIASTLSKIYEILNIFRGSAFLPIRNSVASSSISESNNGGQRLSSGVLHSRELLNLDQEDEISTYKVGKFHNRKKIELIKKSKLHKAKIAIQKLSSVIGAGDVFPIQI